MQKVLIILGPTAVGKTKVALEIADKLNGEIVSADSRQVYKYMDIGTAKPTSEEQRRVPHHLIDIINPDEKFSAAEYAKRATEAIYKILKKRKKPIVVGGSGLYIKALTEGLFEGPGANPKIRKKLEREAEELGNSHLYQRLKTIDPAAAKKIYPNDLKRIIRALEVYELTGKTISELHQKGTYFAPEFEFVKAGLGIDRKELYRRIEDRVDRMLSFGFVEEVRNLIKMGYSSKLNALDTLGYKEIFSYLQGETDLNGAIEKTKQSTRNYAKRQLTWFRKDKEIIWFDAKDENLANKMISHL
ncbi:MAG: tRNA (adenosine(37)-N6)-dimethylallyltransferase MiaA [candidate division Zixibacteria bacterium]|nr:tRNA (adenosine(37)-N6)-dimethylallyltransferase MiaA [candidate division Zixibacteria bacterium]